MATKFGEMRETLLGAMEDVRTGKLSVDKATCMAKLAQAVTSSIQVEVNALFELRNMGKKLTAADLNVGGLQLGEIAEKAGK